MSHQTRTLSRALLLLIWLFPFAFCGCDQKTLLKKFTPEADDQIARAAIDNMLKGDVDAVVATLPPAMRTAEGRNGAGQLIALFQHGTAKNIEVIGAFTQIGFGTFKGRTVRLSYQLELSTGWFTGTIITVEEGGARYIHTARFNPIEGSLEKLNAFGFAGKGLLHYLFFTLAVSIPIFCVTMVVVCARSPIRRKWLWIIFILLGFVSFKLNWTSGEVGWQLINVRLLGASALKAGPYAPWVIGIAIPIGAIVFLLKRKNLITHNLSPAITELPPVSP